MNRDGTIKKQDGTNSRLRHVAAGVVVLTLAVLGSVILVARQQLRSRVREQIAGRDAQVLQVLWMNQQASDWASARVPVTDDPADHLVSLLDTNRFQNLPSVKATRLFDTKKRFVIGFPEDVTDATLADDDFKLLQSLEPVAHFLPKVMMNELRMSHEAGPAEPFPVLEILLPLHTREGGRLLGVAQFLLDGSSISREFRALDETLDRQALVAFLSTGSVLSIALGLAFRALRKSHQLLAHRSQSLLRANRELALAAKTSALGAVTAHLLHGLKNPLSGLQSFMTGRNPRPEEHDELDWAGAIATTQRMHTLVNETVRVLREQDCGIEYELSAEELGQLARVRLDPAAKSAGVTFRSEVRADVSLNNREANILLLVIENLVNNAIQASPRGKTVALRIQQAGATLVCEVEDQGKGLPEHLKATLFQPCQSTKEGGSGIGLAISKQLAASISGDLSLKHSSGTGCVFVLAVPVEVLAAAGTQTLRT